MSLAYGGSMKSQLVQVENEVGFVNTSQSAN